MLTFIIAIPSTSFAFFCPTNFNQIDFGNTMDQVSIQCGKPDVQNAKEVKQEGPQEWSYFIPQTVSSNTLQPMQGTLRTQITFDASGNAINISVNGIGVGNSTICGGLIQLGDSRDRIKAICGNPSFINRQSEDTASGPPQVDKITTFIYNTNPPVKLTFKNGALVERN